MKLGLLIVLAVVVLVPSLSEGRIVSRCELKEKLGEMITLPSRLQKLKKSILATVICEVERRSHLNTGLVRVFGDRRTTTVRPTLPTKTLSTPRANETTTKTVPELTQATSPSVANETHSESIGSRIRREAHKSSGENSNERSRNGEETDTTSDESDMTEMDGSLEEVLNEEESKFDEEEMEQDDNRMGDEDEESDEEGSEQEDLQKQEFEEGWKRKKPIDPRKLKKRFVPRIRHNRRWKSWSLGYYGLFQLSDSTFCDSGYHWTRNACRSSCKGFTDDDITDDINCFVKSRYWLYLLNTAGRQCSRTKNFFNGCT